MVLAMFAHYLQYDLRYSAEATSGHLAGLRYHFKCRFCAVDAFDSPHLKACRRALFLDPEAYHPPKRQTLPMTLEMVLSLTRHFTSPSLRKRIIVVATALAFCCLLRPSEYCQPQPGENEHTIRAAQVLFEWRRPAPYGSTFHSADALPPAFVFSQCASVKIVFLTAKNKDLRSAESLWFSAHTGARIDLPLILFGWARAAHLQASDPFVAYRPSPHSLECLQYGRFNKILKYTARLFGLDPGRYACHALRVGGASLLKAAGVDNDTIMAMGRWLSLPSCLGYQAPSSATNDRILHILGTPGPFTVRDVLLSEVPAQVFERARPRSTPHGPTSRRRNGRPSA